MGTKRREHACAPHIQGDGQEALRVHATCSHIDQALADRNAHAVCTKVTKAKDAPSCKFTSSTCAQQAVHF